MKRRPYIAAGWLLAALMWGPVQAGELIPYNGEPAAPGLALEDMAGKRHTLADYRGQVLLVNFWATWCPPCLKEMPAMQRLRQAMAGQPFEILAVSMGDSPEQIQQFLERMPLDFPILLDSDMKAAQNWKIRVVPTSFLLDPDGKIRYWLRGDLEWDAAEPMDLIRSLMPL